MCLYYSLSNWSSLVLVGYFAFSSHAHRRTHIIKQINFFKRKERWSLGFLHASVHRDNLFFFWLHKQKRSSALMKIEDFCCLEHMRLPCGCLLNWHYKNITPEKGTSVYASILCPAKWRIGWIQQSCNKMNQSKINGTALAISI